MTSLRRHLSYANVVATLALLFAMSSGALAASHYLINSTKQINPKVLKALGGKTGPAGSSGAAGGPGLRGPQGEPGLKGEAGHTGPSGISGYQRVVGSFVKSSGVGSNSATATVICPAGTSVLGGGFETFFSNSTIDLALDGPIGSEGWEVTTNSTSVSPYEVHAVAICAKVAS